MSPLPRRAPAVAQAVFFLSGFAALLYQMVWQRLLTFFGGADVYSVTLIVAAFMAGLGFGSLLGGHVADRLGLRRRLLAFAAAEAAIALFGLFSVAVIYDGLYVRLGAADLPRAAMALVLLGVLLWPTFFMGLSLPMLARALTEGVERPSARIAALYGWNTLGAAVGSLVTVWWILRAVDFRTATWIGAALNALCAVAALLLARAATDPAPETAAAVQPVEPGSPGERGFRRPAGFSLGTWIALYALAGFVALSLEIVWFRVLDVILKANSFTFATLLSLYLAGVGGGALLGGRFARRSEDPARIFLLLQAAIAVYAALALAAFLAAAPKLGLLRPVWEYMAGYEGLQIDAAVRSLQRFVLEGGAIAPQARRLVGLLLLLYVALPAFLIGPPTFFMGLSFPFLQAAIQTEERAVGRRVGWLQAANIVGSTLGSILTGLWLLDQLGTPGTLRVLVLLAAVFAALLFARLLRGARRPAAWATVGALGAALVTALVWIPRPEKLWARLHGTAPDAVVVGEDGSGLSVLKYDPVRAETIVYANGVGQSELPYGSFHAVLGALPVLIHPRPQSVALIGLGSGETLFGAGGREETALLQSIEIIEPQLDTLVALDRRHFYAGLRTLLSEPRARHVFTDGRAFILKGRRAYDVIEADALRPTSAYSGNLYSREYFDLLRRHLAPGGLAVTWEPTERVRRTVLQVFPHVLAFRALLIGSADPIPYDPAVVRQRLRDPFTESYYRRGGVDIAALLEPFLASTPVRYGPEFDRSRMTDVNSDLFPKDEYMVGRSFRPGGAP